MLRVKREESPIFMLVGNKMDKVHEREVSREEGMDMARQFGCSFMETSAKTAHNVEPLFATLVRSLRDTRPEPRVHASRGMSGGGTLMRKRRKCVIL